MIVICFIKECKLVYKFWLMCTKFFRPIYAKMVFFSLFQDYSLKNDTGLEDWKKLYH